jgi:Cobalamin-independent synthase, Catalytic domain
VTAEVKPATGPARTVACCHAVSCLAGGELSAAGLADRPGQAGRFPPRVRSGLDCQVRATLDGKTIIQGVLDLSDHSVETPETVAGRVERALPHVPPGRLVLAPDCGMKCLPRDAAFGKLAAMARAATMLRGTG